MATDAALSILSDLSPSSRAVIAELLSLGPLPRAALARRMGQSPASLTKITRPLLDAGVLIEEKGIDATIAGRPGKPLAVSDEAFRFIGVKITQDALFGVLTNAQGEVKETLSATLTQTDQQSVIASIVNCVNSLAGEDTIQAVGIGSSGKMRRFDDRVRQNTYLDLDGVELSKIIQERTGFPTTISNDVRALTAAVQWSGPGRGHQDFAVLTIGVGLGLGIVTRGAVLDGSTGGAGLIGHLPITHNGPLCDLGHRGCPASFLHTEMLTHSIALAHGLPAVDLEGACALADHGDAVALRVFADAGHALGATVASLVNILGIPLVILTGDGLPMWPHIKETMHAALETYRDPQSDGAEIRVYDSDFDEWARGAAVVACQWALTGPRAQFTQ